MNKREKTKLIIKAKLNNKTGETDTKIKIYGDNLQAYTSAIVFVVKSAICSNMDKKTFLKKIGNSYDILVKQIKKEGENYEQSISK